MSIQNEPQTSADGYADTAYRADAIPEQSYAPKNERLRGRILETRLPWGSYLGVNPTTYQYSDLWFQEYQYIGDDYHDYTMINESRWSQRVDENVNDLYRIARFFFVIFSHGFSFVGGGGWVFTGIAIFVSVSGTVGQLFVDEPRFPFLLLGIPLTIGGM